MIFILLPAIYFSQQTKIIGDFKMKSSEFKKSDYDESFMNIYYQLKSEIKQNSIIKSAESICVLQIGDNFSKFTDVSTLKLDSLKAEFAKIDFVGAKEMNLMFQYKPLWTSVTIKDFSNSNIIQQNTIHGRLYRYEEQEPKLDWQLKNETKTILGYECKKAILHYRGRNYIAWYSSEIAINEGPYVFQNLPGMILELQDDDNYVHFTAVAIEKIPKSIYIVESSTLLKVSREKYREVKKNYFENPGAFLNTKAFNEDGTQILMKPNSTKVYNPLELE
jgi:GLPGLI family protein